MRFFAGSNFRSNQTANSQVFNVIIGGLNQSALVVSNCLSSLNANKQKEKRQNSKISTLKAKGKYVSLEEFRSVFKHTKDFLEKNLLKNVAGGVGIIYLLFIYYYLLLIVIFS